MLLNIISFSTPLILAAIGALFGEYAGALPLFLDGLITFSGFLTYSFTRLTGSVYIGTLLSIITSCGTTALLSYIVEKTKANKFIAAIAINLFYSSVVSLLSSIIFHTRGILYSPHFLFPAVTVQIVQVGVTIALVILVICFLKFSQKGIYFRISGSDSNILIAKGVDASAYKIWAWTVSAFFAAVAGTFMELRVSSFVPNLAGGKGWLALAAVFLGRKKIWKIVVYVIIFCGVEFLCGILQSYIPNLPSSLLLALPYLVALFL